MKRFVLMAMALFLAVTLNAQATQQRYEQAEVLIDAASARYPKNVMFVTNAGILAFSKGDFKKALDKFFAAEKLDQKDHVVLLNIAYTYGELGDKSNAKKYYGKVKKYCSPEIAAEADRLMRELGD